MHARHLPAAGHDRGIFDDRAQLSHVARPVMRQERAHRVRAERQPMKLMAFPELIQEMSGQLGHVLDTVDQRRGSDGVTSEPKEQIRAHAAAE